MKKIRIGKDINLRWEILTNGEKVSLENRDLKLELVTPLRTRIDLPFVTSFNIIEIIKVTAQGGQSAQITIKQAAGDAFLNITPSGITLEADGSAVTVTVQSNTTWTVS